LPHANKYSLAIKRREFLLVKCWICGGRANSREHKFKKSDLIRSSTTWAPDDKPYFVSGGVMRPIASPKDKIATFGKVLCSDCNNARTQPFDLAYESFSRWVNQADRDIMMLSHLDFSAIYGADFGASVLNLMKYFIKHLGCRLASDRYSIPAGFASILCAQDVKPFEMTFARSHMLGDLPARGHGILANYATFGTYSPSTQTVRGPYITGSVVGYLDVIIRHDFAARYPWEGDSVDHNLPTVRLGLYEGPISGVHLFDGELPGPCISREFRIGELVYRLPILSPENIQHVLSLKRPTPGMPLDQDIECRLTLTHAILSPFFPEMTIPFLEENLSIPETEAILRLVFPK
jgi:hypothetical protein